MNYIESELSDESRRMPGIPLLLGDCEARASNIDKNS